jgi:hypothetical protein
MGLAIPNPLAHSANVGAKQVGRKAVSLHPECFGYRIKSGLRVFGFCPAGSKKCGFFVPSRCQGVRAAASDAIHRS